MTAMLVGVHPVLAESAVTASVQFYARLGFTLVFQVLGWHRETRPGVPESSICATRARTVCNFIALCEPARLGGMARFGAMGESRC